mmetsp:Transcript_4147/g.8979  ORF Transcript_4147/g.8979 Transcript_4147/m.8979 type:complete len:242 (+) Transcript_4147:31-756(+)
MQSNFLGTAGPVTPGPVEHHRSEESTPTIDVDKPRPRRIFAAIPAETAKRDVTVAETEHKITPPEPSQRTATPPLAAAAISADAVIEPSPLPDPVVAMVDSPSPAPEIAARRLQVQVLLDIAYGLKKRGRGVVIDLAGTATRPCSVGPNGLSHITMALTATVTFECSRSRPLVLDLGVVCSHRVRSNEPLGHILLTLEPTTLGWSVPKAPALILPPGRTEPDGHTQGQGFVVLSATAVPMD